MENGRRGTRRRLVFVDGWNIAYVDYKYSAKRLCAVYKHLVDNYNYIDQEICIISKGVNKNKLSHDDDEDMINSLRDKGVLFFVVIIFLLFY